MSKIPGPDRFWWRFVAGQPLDGHYRTDATFFRAGRKTLGKVQPRRWSYLPGWVRALSRVVGVLVALLEIWGWAFHRAETIAVAGASGAVAALYAVLRAVQAHRRRKVYRRYVKPLHAALSPLLGLPPVTRAGEYITVPTTYRTNEATPAVIRLPSGFNPSAGNKETISTAALAYLGLNEDNTDVLFHFVGNPTLELKMAPQPPQKVLWAEHRELMAELPAGQIFVGLGARDKPYIRDFNAGEVVHGGFSVQTGRGKSAALMAWMAQVLHTDPEATATVIDPKQSAGPTCLVGIPGYRLANDPDDVPEMWSAIEAFEREIIRRRHARILDPTKEFPLMYLCLDELSELADMTRETWEEVRENPEKYGYEGSLPKRAPIWRSISRILRMSREYGGRVLVFTQRLDNASTGGIGLRDLFGWRGLAGFRKNQWMMLIGTMPVPKSIRGIGRWIYSDGDKEVWVQNVYGTPEELRDWAIAGRRTVQDTQAGHSADDGVSSGGTLASVRPEVVGLQAAADHLGIPVGTFRKYRPRAGIIPREGLQGRSPTWMKNDLDRWYANEIDNQASNNNGAGRTRV